MIRECAAVRLITSTQAWTAAAAGPAHCQEHAATILGSYDSRFYSEAYLLLSFSAGSYQHATMCFLSTVSNAWLQLWKKNTLKNVSVQ